MNLDEFLDVIQCDLSLTRYNCQNDRWSASIKRCEISDDGFLIGRFGNGHNPDDAINDYIKKIRGKVIVINALSENRKEFHVPDTITLIGDY